MPEKISELENREIMYQFWILRTRNKELTDFLRILSTDKSMKLEGNLGSMYDSNVEDKDCMHNVVEELTWKVEKGGWGSSKIDVTDYNGRWGETDSEFGHGISRICRVWQS